MFFPGVRYPLCLCCGDTLQITYLGNTLTIGPVETITVIQNEIQLLTLLGL